MFVCLSVTLLYCVQMVGWIKMTLGMQVGIGPGHVVLDDDPALPPPKGQIHPILGPYLLWPNGCMDQDATWYGGKPRPRRPCIRWGPRSPSPKRKWNSQIFGPYLLCPNGWMDQDALGMEVGLSPGDFMLDAGPSPSPKRGGASQFSAYVYCGQTRLHGSRCHLVRR